MNSKAAIGGFALLVTLSACGKVGPLQPAPGQAPPAKAYGQVEAPSTESLMEPSVQARPGRSDELMRRSERRTDDAFDLPPGSDEVEAKPGPAPAPAPTAADNSPSKPK
jgi:predicted small lipoprotein YifL